MYQIINVLPSNFVFYRPNKPTIKVKPLSLGDVEFLSTNRENLNNYLIFNHLLENKTVQVEMMDPFELTVHDSDFILLFLTSISFSEVTFPIKKKCNKCSKDYEKVSVSRKGKPEDDKSFGIKHLTISDIMFKDINPEEVKLPIVVDLSIGKTGCSPLRLKHLKDNDPKDWKDIISEVLWLYDDKENKITINDLSLEDIEVIDYIYSEILYHGARNEIEIKCLNCGNPLKVEVDWEGIDFIPFRRDKDSIRAKIHFGLQAKSTITIDKSDNIHRGFTDIGTVSRISKTG